MLIWALLVYLCMTRSGDEIIISRGESLCTHWNGLGGLQNCLMLIHRKSSRQRAFMLYLVAESALCE